VLVTLRPADAGDFVSTVFRTLEVWTERPVLSQSISTAPAGGQAPPNLLKAKRTFLASSDEPVTARIDPVSVFHESVVLAGKQPGCVLVRYSAEVRGEDVDANDSLYVNFRVRIGFEVPPHPNLFDLTPSEQPQIVTFSAFRCGLEPGEVDVDVEVESPDDDDPVEVRSRVLEVFTETGRPAPAVE
jgi:hypothetical protein